MHERTLPQPCAGIGHPARRTFRKQGILQALRECLHVAGRREQRVAAQVLTRDGRVKTDDRERDSHVVQQLARTLREAQLGRDGDVAKG